MVTKLRWQNCWNILRKLQKLNQEEFKLEKVIKREKVINYMLNGGAIIILLMVKLIKKDTINEWTSSKTTAVRRK